MSITKEGVAKIAIPLVRNVVVLMNGTVYLVQVLCYCRDQGEIVSLERQMYTLVLRIQLQFGFRCVAECGQGFYQTAGRCSLCPHTCKTCVSRLNCTTCANSLRLQSGTCRSTCAAGYYPDEGTCSKCYLSCETCTGPRRDQCASCPPDWRLAAGECRPECPQNFFTWGDSCRRCHHYCQDCHGAGPQRCTSCPQHFSLENGLCVECLSSQYYEIRTRTCRPCHDSCRSCSGPGPTSCVTCAHPLRLDRYVSIISKKRQ